MARNDLAVKELAGVLDGSDYIGDTTLHTNETWVSMVMLTDCEFSTLTSDINNLPSPFIFRQGAIINGKITAIQLNSGNLIAYRGRF